MLVDAVGVFLPNDPDGNAKLVFSILDCLPKANRVSCLLLILPLIMTLQPEGFSVIQDIIISGIVARMMRSLPNNLPNSTMILPMILITTTMMVFPPRTALSTFWTTSPLSPPRPPGCRSLSPSPSPSPSTPWCNPYDDAHQEQDEPTQPGHLLCSRLDARHFRLPGPPGELAWEG